MSFRLKNTESYLISFVNNLKRLSIQELKKPIKRSYSSGRVINEPLNASRSLSQSLIVETKSQKNKFNATIKGNSYGEKVDEGTKSGTSISSNDIVNWINRKPVTLEGLNQQKLSNVTSETKNRIANQIAQKIKREGIKPTNFLTNLVNEQFNKLKGIENIITEDINLDIDKFMQSIGYTKNGETFKIEQ
jgi:hypothetical protein